MSKFNRIQRRRIGEILVDQGLVTRDHVEEALRIQRKTGETLGTILVDMGCVTDLDITKTIVLQYQLPYINLENYSVSDKLCERFPAEFLYQNKIFPFDKVGAMILLAVAEVPSEEVLAEIPRMTRSNVALYVSSMTEVEQYLHKVCPLTEEQIQALEDRKRNGGKSGAAPGKPKASGSGDKAKIFDEESSEAILEALDSTWDSIFDSVEDSEETVG